METKASNFEPLFTTVGEMRSWAPRKQYVTRWLHEHEYLPGETKVRVTPWTVDIVDLPMPQRITITIEPMEVIRLSEEFDSIVPDEDEQKRLLDEAAAEIERNKKQAAKGASA